MGKNLLSASVIVIIAIVVLFNLRREKQWQNEERVIFWDVKSLYAYLPIVIIHGDPTASFVFEELDVYGNRIWLSKTETGLFVPKTTMGMSVMYLPFFMAGHIVAHLTGAEITGYSTPYLFFLLISSLFYLIVGMIFVRKILLQFFADYIVAITLLIVFFGTNLLWYSTFEATMSHAYSFALFSIFIYLTIQWHSKPTRAKSVLLGIVTGLITLIRPTNALIVLFFLLYNIKSFKDVTEKFRLYISHPLNLIIIVMMGFVVLFPQLLFWKLATGSWFVYSYGENEQFFFNNPQIINGLFSFRKGWFIYTPVMLPAVLAIAQLWRDKKLRQFLLPILLFLVLNVYIILSWWSWWYGGGLGLRAFIESYALLAIPLAALISYLFSKPLALKIPGLAVLAAFSAYGFFTNVQYYHGAIHWDSMTKSSFMDSFLRKHPSENFKSLLKEPDFARYFSLMDDIFCDAESISKARDLFRSTSVAFYFNGVNKISTEKAYSGSNSVMLNQSRPYGLTTALIVREGDVFEVSVKRYSDHNKGYLVIQADEPHLLYATQGKGEPTDKPGWERLSISITMPAELDNKKVIFYCYNPYQEDAFFDDIRIQLIKPGN